ncbi:hypothetical protein [Clostridium sp. 'White wine YQ']|uniref:hypothetical protein n=1 Tax=Clostridium sp. 'White wine YQ' TaxID=3027474 RepID=UPI0023654C06|nr:hypothetical protein [Clostridium sp. 'White wine YQ']MDD7795912.1 hypothetical protein [Clostridium sp. 'White wine YQ']
MNQEEIISKVNQLQSEYNDLESQINELADEQEAIFYGRIKVANRDSELNRLYKQESDLKFKKNEKRKELNYYKNLREE